MQARRRCAAWFQSATTHGESSDHDHSSANASHEHFIGVLEHTWSILKPRFEAPRAAKASTSAKSSSPELLSNRFDALEIESIDEKALKLMVNTAVHESAKGLRQNMGNLELRRTISWRLTTAMSFRS
jgi:hypothetical protein